MRITRTFLAIALLAALLLVVASAYGLQTLQVPTVPHPAEEGQDCLTCHGAGQFKPVPQDHEGRTIEVCLMCHQVEVAEGLPAVPHPTEGREDCLMCHETGGLKPFPDDHEDRTSDVCQICHQAGAAGEIPTVPHPTEDREDCLVCHDTGQLKPFPEDHEGRDSTTCLGCHQAGAAGQIPTVPHPTEDREDCLVCHDTGQLKPFPEDHEGRDSTTCLACHEGGVVGQIPTVSHPLEGRKDCLICHNTGMLRPFPEDHAGRNIATCLACHEAGPVGQIPEIPHPVKDREDCLACHDTGQLKPFPADHEGRESTSCQECHQAQAAGQIPAVPHPTERGEDCLACHDTDRLNPFPADHAGRDSAHCLSCHPVKVTGLIPEVLHTGEGRESCLDCHGLGQLKPFPANHEGRDNTYCLMCHQFGGAETPTPDPTPESNLPPSVGVVPTPIHEPELFEDNTCITCHEELGGKHAHITLNWSQSVHAARGVGCVSCHGGDPTQANALAAMSPEAGYLGPLTKDRIPGLCGSCHTRVDLMRSYDLPTDQLAQYWQSQHGQLLLEGDTNVATCFDCHDGHRVLKTSDPASEVYPRNEPAMCARCHADEELMEPYGIPTSQYELYQESVHGVALLQNQDLRAPACSTCHGKHGAAPPGFEEVSNVCGRCHAATQDYYLQGAHRTGMTGEAAPRCVTCHGRYDVQPATREILLGMEDDQGQPCGSCHAPGEQERHCGSCHAPGTETAEHVGTMYQMMDEASVVYEEAEAVIAEAAEQRLIMAEQEELLQRARTPLIELRAMQHTVNLADIQAKAEESMELSRQAQTLAEEALQEIDVRRMGMVVALGIILITILALALIKHELDRELEAQRARRRDGLPQG